MKLVELLDGFVDVSANELAHVEVSDLALDSRRVKAGSVFFALSGSHQHGLVYAPQAIANGAVVIVYEPQGSEALLVEQTGICYLPLQDLGEKLGLIAHRFFLEASQQLKVIGITGTNGKTSCSQFLLQLLPDSGVIGTLGWGDGKGLQRSLNTTPDALTIQRVMADFVRQHKRSVVMEVSSHGLQQGRVNGVAFYAAVLTNFSRDHLDYHQTMEAYLQAKLVLFKRPELDFVVLNADDAVFSQVLSVVPQGVRRWAFSLKDFELDGVQCVRAVNPVFSLQGLQFDVCWNQQQVTVHSAVVGEFNLQNLLAVITVLLALDYQLSQIVELVAGLKPVDGRMQRVSARHQPVVFIDYAHTPDALTVLLSDLKKHCLGQLCVVFGCGGNRDMGKREQMGRVACEYADKVVLTDDNPRFECAEQIIEDILLGCMTGNDVEVIADRKVAIETAVSQAKLNDCVVIAGKGHEDYQEIEGVRHYLSDADIAQQALLVWGDRS